MWRAFLTMGIFCTLAGCASFPETMDRIKAGMDKGEVLEILGNPKRTFRENGLDYWTYLYFENNQEWRRDVVFEGGKVIRVTRPTPTAKSGWQRDLENSTTIEEYEAKARAINRKSERFKPIGPADGD